MELTGLEVTLGGLCLTAVGGWITSLRSMSKSECERCRIECGKRMSDRMDEIEHVQTDSAADVSRKMDMLFRMVRFLILRSDATPEEKERVLNDRSAI